MFRIMKLFQKDDEKNKAYRWLLMVIVSALLVIAVFQWSLSYIILKSGLVDAFYYFVQGNIISSVNGVERILEESESFLFSLANDPDVKSFWFDKEPSVDQLQRIQNKIMQGRMEYEQAISVHLYNEHNQLTYSSNQSATTHLDNLWEEEKHLKDIFLITERQGDFYEAVVLPPKGYQKVLCVKYFPYDNSGNAIVVQMVLREFVEQFNAFEIYEGCYYMLLNEDNSVFYSNVGEQTLIDAVQKASVKSNEDNPNDRFLRNHIGGENYYSASFYSGGMKKTLMILIPENVMYSNTIFDRLSSLFTTLIWVLLLVLFLVILMRKILIRHEKRRDETALINLLNLETEDGKQKLLQDILENADDIEWKNIPERSLAEFLHEGVLLLLCRVAQREGETEYEAELAVLDTAETFRKEFSRGRAERVLLSDGQFALLVKPTEEMDDTYIRESIQKAREACADKKVSVAIGKTVAWRQLNQEFESLSELMEYRYLYGTESVLLENMKRDAGDEAFEELLQQVFLFKKELLDGTQTQASEMLSSLWLRFTDFSPDKVKTIVIIILGMYQELFDLLRKKTGMLYAFDYSRELKRITEAQTLEEVRADFDEYFAMMVLRQPSERNERHEYLCYRVKKLVEENYSNMMLGTEWLAEELATSSGYLGKLFKKNEGTSILNYILKYRMMKAKELLESNEEISISAISEMVGYSSSSYFGALFKKEFKMTPGDYRNKVLRDEIKK